ncbi:hypothetical protein ACFFR3_09780 [Nonomuraea salmonea]|jgi:hypothetical protein|uniref:Uncharacterized protein n=1 Tax=Nonomuraea salmonea TaxID=46181 RepID=A0ABV5NHR2_9ACTN
MHAPDLLIQQVAAVLVHSGVPPAELHLEEEEAFSCAPSRPRPPRLLAALLLTRHRSIMDVLHWSDWRRRHQTTARRCHYQRRSQP